MKNLIFLICLSVLLCSQVFALPEGYLSGNLNLPEPPSTQSAVFTVDSNNVLYFGHATGLKTTKDTKAGKGNSSEIWLYDTINQTYSQFYVSPGTNPSMNSVAGIWIDETTTPWTYYLADQQPDPDEPWTTGAVWIAKDINSDGDIMDTEDYLELYTTDISVLVYISDIIRNDATGDIFVTNAEGIQGNPMVYRLADDNSNGVIETAEMTAYYNLETSSAFAGGLTFGQTTDEIYTHETSGSIYRLVDGNGDGDALDAGEAVVHATLPLAGAYDIDMDPDGDLFVTGSDWGTMTHAIYEVTTDATPVITLFDDITAIAGSSGTIAFGNGYHFEPDSPTDGAVLYINYSTQSYTDPETIPFYASEESCVNNGDVNFDDEITAGDGQMAFLIALGSLTPTPAEACAADCNGDDEVTAGDGQQIFLAALGSGSCVDPL